MQTNFATGYATLVERDVAGKKEGVEKQLEQSGFEEKQNDSHADRKLTSMDALFAKIVADNSAMPTTANPEFRFQCLVLPHHPPAGLQTYFGYGKKAPPPCVGKVGFIFFKDTRE